MANQPNQQAVTLVKRLFDEVYSKNNVAAMDQIISNDVKLQDVAVPNFRGGLSALKEKESSYAKAFPNRNAKIDDIISSDDKVIVFWTMTAVQKGEFQDIPPSGKNVKISGISIYTVANNKITAISQSWDRLGLLEQIGAVEPSAAFHQ